MPLLAPLNWKRHAWTAVGGTGSVLDVLTAIAAALADVTWYDGSARIPADWWTIEAAQAGPVALVLRPPNGGVEGICRVIFAGQAAALAGTQVNLASDVAVVNELLCNVFKNTGDPATFTTWDAAAPLTGADQTGYARVGPATLVTTPATHVLVIEGTEAICVVVRSATGLCWPTLAGAIFDPASTNALDAETDPAAPGRLYGMLSPGTTSPVVGFFNAPAANAGSFTKNAATNGHAKAVAFTPGLATLIRPNAPINLSNTAAPDPTTALNMRTTSGLVAERVNLTYGRTPAGAWLGRLRDAYVATNALCSDIIRANAIDPTTDQAYGVGGNSGAPGNLVWLATLFGAV